MNTQTGFRIGYDVGFVGRWFRLIVGLYFSILTVAGPLVGDSVPGGEALPFLAEVGLYFTLILGVYVAAFYFLGERLLAHANPWVGTILLLGPLVLAGALQLGPPAFLVALGLYYSVASIFNFAMSYGGCEVVAIPSLIFRRRYTLYCPYNAVDAVENAIMLGSAGERFFGVLSMAIAVVVGGYFLLVEDFGMIRDLGVHVDLYNAWALLLLVPIAFMLRNAWVVYQKNDREFNAVIARQLLGAGVLAVLTVMFVIGADVQPIWGVAMVVGGLVVLYRWLRGGKRQPRLDREGQV